MSTIEGGEASVAAQPEPTGGSRRGILFWVIRYLPAEIAGTAAMIIAGLAVTFWTDNAAVIAVAALVGEIVGFYAVLFVVIYLEQSRSDADHAPATRGRLVLRTLMLLAAEFGAAELLDTFLVRPAALLAGVLLLQDPVWGLLAGKVVADVVFYAVAAGAFTVTDRTGLRRRRAERRVS
jgi:hypothetical protein